MNSDRLERTPLYDEHLAAGARLVPFAGWEMPVQYPTGILEEHRHTRRAAGLFDICHMGELRVKGPGAAAALDARLARGVIDQPNGSCRYNLLLNEAGGLLDDLVVYRLGDEEFLLVVNAGCRAGDAAAIRSALPAGVIFADESAATAKLDLQGPESAAVLAGCGWHADRLPGYYRWVFGSIDGIDILLSRTGYTGELGFELYGPAERAAELWRRLLADDRVRPVGLGARDTLRLEVGYPLYGHELDADHTADESGLSAKIFTADTAREFFGKAGWSRRPPQSRIVALKIAGRRAARAGMTVTRGGRPIGQVTSGVFAPSLEYAIALARLDESPDPGEAVEIVMERGLLPAEVTLPPFYAAGSARVKL